MHPLISIPNNSFVLLQSFTLFCTPFRLKKKMKRKRKNRKLRKTVDFIAVSADMEVDYVSTNEALQPDARQEEDEGPHCEEKAAWHQGKQKLSSSASDMPPSSSQTDMCDPMIRNR